LKKNVNLLQKKREEGNEFFKQGKLNIALRKYKKAIEFIPSDSSLTEEQKKEVKVMKVPCHLNHAICLIKEKKWKDALEQTEKVLEVEPKNIKGLYRKGLVLIGLDRWEEAMKLLVEAKELDPTNTAIQQEIQKLKHKINQHNKREANIYKNLFQRIDQIEQEEEKEKKLKIDAEKELHPQEPVVIESKQEVVKEEPVKEEPMIEEVKADD